MDAVNHGELRLDHDFLATTILGSEALSAGPTQPVVPTSLELESEKREGLYAHPPWSVSRYVVPGPKARLVTSLGLLEECWGMSNGVQFVVEITRPGSLPSTVFRYWLCPQLNACDRNWVDVVVDLSAYSGETIMVTMRTEGGYAGSLICDGAAWARPVVVSRT